MDLFDYPTDRAWKAPGTSADAAKLASVSAPRLRARCLEAIAAAPAGLTADQVAEMVKHDKCSIRARVSELFKMGEIQQNGRAPTSLGASAWVWILPR